MTLEPRQQREVALKKERYEQLSEALRAAEEFMGVI
jgi:hypothetical protein